MSPETAQSSTASEQSAEQIQQGQFGPAELTQYPGEDGLSQLAESYSTPGTEVQWANNQFTAPGENRRALIATSDHRIYYLRGNTLYGVSEAAKTGKPQEQQLDDSEVMPDLTIGAPATLFGKPVEIRRVLIATEVSDADDLTAKGARTAFENPFDAMDNTFDSLRSKAVAEKQAEREKLATQKDTDEEDRKAAERQRKADEYRDQQAQALALRMARDKLALAQAEAGQDRNKRPPAQLPFGSSGLPVELGSTVHTQHTWRESEHRPGQTTNLKRGSKLDKFDALPTAVSELRMWKL